MFEPRCTTRFKNAQKTVFRELLYHWHPWFGMQVAMHEAVDKADGVVFRCTLSGSAAASGWKCSFELAAVEGVGCKANQSCDLFAVHAAELRQERN